MAGVLVLVEQHHAEALPQLLANLRKRRRQPGGRSHLRAEVHHLLGMHALMQRVDQRHQLRALGLGRQHPQQPLAGTAVSLIWTGGQCVHEPLQLDVGVGQLLRVDEMLGHRPGEPQHHRGDGGRCLVGVQGAGVLGDDAKGQLPHLCFAEKTGAGLDRQQQAVLAQQCARERVIRAHRRRVVGAVKPARHDAGACQPRQAGANPAQELSGGLACEREAEHFTGRGIAVGHQPHHPGGHRLGLAGTRARDDNQRARRCCDHRSLLFGGGEKT